MTLEILTSDLLTPVHHGFFTRKGGASSGIFQGLNCGLGSSDQREAVELNRTRVAEAMGVETEALARVRQIHSADVATVSHHSELANLPQADAIVTDQEGIALTILTADCQPILFADTEAGVIGAAHAGWKGALGGVIEATVDHMQKLGARRENISAAIGPSISQGAYEVGPEFLAAFVEQDPLNTRFFKKGEGDRMLFDLPALGLHKLREAGIGQAVWTGHCTYSDPDRFYSYRRSTHLKEADYGRLIACIRL